MADLQDPPELHRNSAAKTKKVTTSGHDGADRVSPIRSLAKAFIG